MVVVAAAAVVLVVTIVAYNSIVASYLGRNIANLLIAMPVGLVSGLVYVTGAPTSYPQEEEAPAEAPVVYTVM